ncbi:MAG: M23 family metallopeptidase [Myxococcaceae bacterium]
MRAALGLTSLLLLAGCATVTGHLVESPSAQPTKQAADARCSELHLRRTALGSRWGEFVRVRSGGVEATVVGQAKLLVKGRVEKQRSFFVSGTDLVIDARWSNESLGAASALESGASVEVVLSELTVASGRCEELSFSIEQGPLKPDIEEKEWIAQLEAKAKPAVVASSSPRPTPTRRSGTSSTSSAPSGTGPSITEWARWQHDADLDTSWAPWPLPTRVQQPLTGSPLARGAWLTWSTQPTAGRRVAEQLAKQAGLKLESPQDMDALVKRVRANVPSDDAAALWLFAGPEPTKQALVRAGPNAELRTLALHVLPHERGAMAPAEQTLMLATAFSLAWPVPDLAELTSPFGMRHHPTLKKEQLHTGLDLSVPIGTLVVATGAGVVVRAGETPVNGRFLVIDHGHGVTTAYLHNSQVMVSVGQRVGAGEFVAVSGSTGRSTGPHVHYQLELEGQPVDPLYFHPLLQRVSARR